VSTFKEIMRGQKISLAENNDYSIINNNINFTLVCKIILPVFCFFGEENNSLLDVKITYL
jgi:hypothetical protein